MAQVTMEKIYKKLLDLEKDVEFVKQVLVPEEKLSEAELRKLQKIKAEMDAGNYMTFEEVFGK